MKMGEREDLNWYQIGSWLAGLLVSTAISASVTLYFFRKYVTPEINETVEEAQRVTKKIAALGGIKKHDYESVSEIEGVVGRALIEKQMPELAGLKMLLPESTWEKVEELLEENPEGALHLYQKYKHLLVKDEQTTASTDF